MKKLEALLESECLDGVLDAFRRASLGAFQATPITTFAPDRHPNAVYRGARHSVGTERLKLEILLRDQDVDAAIDAIRRGVEPRDVACAEIVLLDVADSISRGALPDWRRPSRHLAAATR